MRIWNHFDSGFGDKHPGSATLIVLVFLAFDRLTFVFLWVRFQTIPKLYSRLYSNVVDPDFYWMRSHADPDANLCGSRCESVRIRMRIRADPDADPDPQQCCTLYIAQIDSDRVNKYGMLTLWYRTS